jgi:hypothetical protein
LGKDLAVGDDNKAISVRFAEQGKIRFRFLDIRRLDDREIVRLGDRFDGGRRQLIAPAPALIRLGDDEGNIKVGVLD